MRRLFAGEGHNPGGGPQPPHPPHHVLVGSCKKSNGPFEAKFLIGEERRRAMGHQKPRGKTRRDVQKASVKVIRIRSNSVEAECKRRIRQTRKEIYRAKGEASDLC